MKDLMFPSTLTEEEEELKQKYAKLKKKKKQLQAMKTPKPEKEKEEKKGTKRQPSESAEDAMLHAKQLVQTGKIKLESESRERVFKRSKHLEKKLKDPEKASSVAFQPYAAAHPQSSKDRDEQSESNRMNLKPLYDSFVSPGGRRNFDRDGRRDYDRESPRHGKTLYIYGHGINEDLLRKTFSNFGKIVNISMESDKNCGFVTFDTEENAEQALAATNGSMNEGIQLKVSIARRQPSFDNIQDSSSSPWASIAADNSVKGTGHKDKRDLLTYSENDDIF